MKRVNRIWAISLITIAVMTPVISVSHFLPTDLSNWCVRTAGVFVLIALPALGYTTVKKLQAKKPPHHDPEI